MAMDATKKEGQNGQNRSDVDENLHGSERSLGQQEERPPEGRSSFREFYRNLKIKTEIDPVAIIALLLSVFSIVTSIYRHFSPESISLFIPEESTFYVDEYVFSQKEKQLVVRVTIPLQFKNENSDKTSIVERVELSLALGKAKKAEFYWEDFVHTQKDRKDPTKLNFTFVGDACAFTVPPNGVEHKEIAFAPRQGEPSNAMAYAISKGEFLDLIGKGEKVEITLTIKAAGKSAKYRFSPKSPTKVAQYINVKGWTVCEIELLKD